MTEAKARKILNELKKVCEDNGVWFNFTEFRHPHLNMIKVNEISIKIDGPRPGGGTHEN